MTAELDLSRHRRTAPKGVKSTLIASTVLALGVVLAGCSAPAEEVAAAPTPEQAYLAEIKEAGTGTVIIPDLEDEELLESGWTACEHYDNAVNDTDFNTAEAVRKSINNGFSPLPEIKHPEGYSDDRIIAAGAVLSVATTHLCTEHRADSEQEFKSLSYLDSY
jgi:hypothetical protein